MKIFLQSTINLINTINEWAGRLVSWLTLLLVLLVCYNVICRHFFNEADAWRGELEWHIFGMIFMLGAGYAFRHDRHVRVDLFYTNYSKKDKAWTNLIGAIVLLIPWSVLIIIYSWDFAMGSLTIDEISPNPNGLKYRYLIKFAIPFGVGLLLLQALSSVAQSLYILIDNNPNETEAIE
ncbi:MAG: TRAP-type mannitol/chloroaromatic compound transport system permease small subunit [Saprospiraceae bacterium]|jgi:TRAP-type mannitol/chloroaromatic compound transport system permease small subunit